MSRKVITLVSAAAIAISGLTATQASALDKRTRNVILGATALAILGAAASQADQPRGAWVGTRNDPYPRGGHTHGHGHGYGHTHGNGHHHGHADNDGHPRGPAPGIHPRPVPPRVIFSELPDRCAFTVGTQDGPARMFETRCLQRNFAHADRLPQSCRRTVKLGSKKVDAYGGACLRERSNDVAWLNRR